MAARKRCAEVIKPNEIEKHFDDWAIRTLAYDSKLPSGADDLKYFGEKVRCAVRDYLKELKQPLSSEIRDAIKRLARQLAPDQRTGPDWLARASDAWDDLPTEARTVLKDSMPLERLPLPSPEDLLDPRQGPRLVRLLYGICHTGMTWREGRRRAGGRRSRPRLVGTIRSPRVRRGQPPNRAEFFLCDRLAIIFSQMTGKKPPQTARHGTPGPFVRLVYGVLDLVSAGDISKIDAVELVNKYGRARQKRSVTQ